MNTERLSTIINQVSEEITETELLDDMSQLQNFLQAAINEPNESNQRNVENQLNKLLDSLANAPSNQFSPGIRVNLQEFKVSENYTMEELLGTGLSTQLGSIFESGYTSVQALDKIRKLRENIEVLEQALKSIKSGFSNLGIQDETLEPGTSVIGITIPRKLNYSKLRELRQQMGFLGQFLVELTEVIEGKVSENEVYSIHSSDFGIDVFTTLTVAAQMSTIVSGIIIAFEKIKGFKNLKKNAEELGVKKDLLDQLTAQSQEIMNKKLEEIHTEIFQDCKVDAKGRVNELKTAIKFRLNGLANRLDNGFRFEVRSELPSEASEEDNKVIQIVKTLGSVEFKNLDGPRLLDLPEEEGVQEKEIDEKEILTKKAKAKERKIG